MSASLSMLAGVFAASVVGSMHCAGMCGPLAAVASSPVKLTAMGKVVTSRHAEPWWRVVLSDGSLALSGIYHAGRLLTYAALGAGAGMIGRAIDLGAGGVGVQRGAAVVAGATLLAMGLIMLARHMGVPMPVAKISPGVTRLLARLNAWSARRGPAVRALGIGMVTTLLPCGWLYAFAVTAAGTADPLAGAMVMLAFWLGTVPILTLVGVGAHRALAPVRRHIPTLTAGLLIVFGLGSLIWRSSPAFAAGASEPSGPTACPLCELSGHSKREPQP